MIKDILRPFFSFTHDIPKIFYDYSPRSIEFL